MMKSTARYTMKAVGSFTKMLPVAVALFISLVPGLALADPGNNYCITPAFIAGGIPPNLLLLFDNSASMYDPAYIKASGVACYDDSYDNTKVYTGYFGKLDEVGNITYPVYSFVYDTATPANSKFVEVATGVPASGGTYRTSYLYIEMSGTKGAADRKIKSFIASGRFLNWLTASKFDTQKQVLTGGKYDTGRQFLVSESRGCVGRRFVRELPLTAWTFPTGLTKNPITFAARGPNSVEPFYNPDTQGGENRIEIYEADFNQTACGTAAQNWIDGNYGTAQTQTGNCFDISGAGNTASGRTLATFNHTMQTCWLLKDNIRKGATTSAAIWQGVNTTDVTGACEKVYTTDGINPDNILDERDGKYVCTSALTGVSPATHQTPIAPWNVEGSDQAGFLGTCWKANSNRFDNANNACVKRELLHYCMGQEFTEVIDPSSTATTGGGVPAVLMDAGIRAIGDPIGPEGSVAPNNQFLFAHVAGTPPSGLLQKYGNNMRIGAMQINDIGSASETMPGVAPASNKDGGKIISFIGAPGVCSVTTATSCTSDGACPSGEKCILAGNHNAGLVKAVGQIEAKSWTPYTEAYYNALAYFVKDATATNSTLDATMFTPTSSAITAPLVGTDSYTNKNPIQFRCQSNYIMMITDGGSTADQNSTVTGKVTDASNYFRDPTTLAETGATSGVCGIYMGSPYLHDLSYFAKRRNIFDPSVSCASGNCVNAQTVNTHVVYTGPATSNLTGVCDPRTQMALTASNGGTTLFEASDPLEFYRVLRDAFSGLVAKGASGTAASILSNSEGSGANILQAVFFPKKFFADETSANWIGEMQNLWYYVDPRINNSTIREDTNQDNSLNLIGDYVARFAFDTLNSQTVVNLQQDTNGDGIADGPVTTVDPDDVKSIWRAGKQLWARDLTVSPRTIYTPLLTGGIQVGSTGLMKFSYASPDNSSVLQSYLQASDPAGAVKLMKYVHGFDFPQDTTMRSRTVKIGNIPASTVSEIATDPYVTNPRDKGIGVWKLGDIITSTPRIQSTIKLNSYDLAAPGGYGDASYSSFINSNQYKQRGMVYVGANDGMLHAFKLGVLNVTATNLSKASLVGSGLGEEAWAFIPKNALPYLNYTSDFYYNHIYFVDGSTTVADVSIGNYSGTGGCTAAAYDACAKNSVVVDTNKDLDPAKNTWRTVLIGSMGLGGASRIKTDTTCLEGSAGTCVKTPIVDPADSTKGLGYSSYFALDVSDPNNPTYMWEFSNSALGYALSGPAIVRIGPEGNNGRWFAVFGSGPTGPIDSITHQFLAKSDQTLKFFVVDLRTGALVHTIDTEIPNAFASSMNGGAIDADRWNVTAGGRYQDEAIYVGYTKKASGGDWTDGGVLRILTKESIDPTGTTPGNPAWVVNKVIDGIGPVTTAIARLQDRKQHQLWLYFGTGRYFYRYGTTIDDYSTRRTLYGIKEPCYTMGDYINPACTTTLSANPLVSDITDRTIVDPAASTSVGAGGWKIDLEEATSTYGAERVVTNTVTLTNGAIFYTTFEPTADACGYGGNSYLWALDYNTGLRPPDSTLIGKALIQLSTGEFKEVNLSDSFTQRDGRRMGEAMTGKPPGDAPPILSTSGNKPIKRILHIQER